MSFGFIPVQKVDSEALKTGCFPYSAFWPTNQRGLQPPCLYATDDSTDYATTKLEMP